MLILLNGLEPRAMRSTAHVLPVIAKRFEGYEQQMKTALRIGRSRDETRQRVGQ
jgi:hypothetical protein